MADDLRTIAEEVLAQIPPELESKRRVLAEFALAVLEAQRRAAHRRENGDRLEDIHHGFYLDCQAAIERASRER